jgi:myosin heavy subunit
LYPELETTRKRVSKLEQEKQDLEAAIDTASAEGKKAKKLEVRLAEVEEQLVSIPQRFNKVMDDTLDSLKREGEQARQRDQLTSLRERLVSSTPEVIPELVTGNTPEELNSSFERSKLKYKEIYGQAAEKARKDLEGSVRGSLPQPVTATGANNNAGGQPNAEASGGLDDWRRMAPSEWEAKKKQINTRKSTGRR